MGLKLLSFYSDTCGPCQIFKPVVNKLEVNFDLEVERVNVATMPGIADQHGVKKVPTLILLGNDLELARTEGANTYMRTVSSLGLTND